MPQTRTFLLLALAFVGYLLWNQWQLDYNRPKPATAPAAAATAPVPAPATTAPSSNVPSVANIPAANTSVVKPAAGMPATTAIIPARARAVQHGPLITVTTDVLRLTIDSRGGNIVRSHLLKYPAKLKSKHAVQLFNDSASRYFVAQSGLINQAHSLVDSQALFHTQKTSYHLLKGQEKITVDLVWTSPAGLRETKRYTLKRGSYVVGVTQTIDNGTAQVWKGWAYHQLTRVTPPKRTYSNWLAKWSDQSRYSFFGAAWYGPEKKYNSIKFDDFAKHSVNRQVTGGWIAMEQPYFMAAWLPQAKQPQQFSTGVDHADNPRYRISATAPGLNIAPGASASSNARLYVGPLMRGKLGAIAPGLDLAVDYGIFTVVAAPMHAVLTWFHGLTGNWGVAIILVVLLINLLLYKLNAAQYRSGAKMRKLKPRMDALKERYGDDKQKLQQATMELYKKEKVNPVAGCLPLLVQIPVFFALYTVLRESVELRQAPFIGWIHDLSAPDPYFVLPALYAGVMVLTQRLMPMTASMDATQAKIMKWMPIVYPIFFAFFPAGLVLYYLVNGLARVAQQWWVMRQFDAQDGKGKRRPKAA